MVYTLIAPPTAEPLTLAEAKAFARIETTDDDAIVVALIAAARVAVERATRRALLTQGWRLTLDALPSDRMVRIDLAPLQAITAIRGRDSSGNVVVIDPLGWSADVPTGRVLFTQGLPATCRRLAGLEIEVTAGYGAATAVPEPLRQAVRLLVACWNDERGPEAERAMPSAVAGLIAPYRRLALGGSR